MKYLAPIFLVFLFACQQPNSFEANVDTNLSIDTTCDCDGFIHWADQSVVEVYDRPNGKVIDRMQNDYENEDFLLLSIYSETEDFFYVSIYYALKDKNAQGWIKKAKYVGGFGNNYDPRSKLVFYSEPSISSTPTDTLFEYSPEVYTYLSCSDDYLLVSLEHDNNLFQGWLNKRSICTSPYTTCN